MKPERYKLHIVEAGSRPTDTHYKVNIRCLTHTTQYKMKASCCKPAVDFYRYWLSNLKNALREMGYFIGAKVLY